MVRHHKSKKGHMHGMHKKYDTLRHERDSFNDEKKHDAEPMPGGPYHYDRENTRMTERSGHRAMGMRGEHYAGAEPRRRQEMEDAGMIHEDQRAIANLPQQVMIKPYPDAGRYTPEDLDDTIRGIDRQIDYDDGKKMQHFYPKKV